MAVGVGDADAVATGVIIEERLLVVGIDQGLQLLQLIVDPANAGAELALGIGLADPVALVVIASQSD